MMQKPIKMPDIQQIKELAVKFNFDVEEYGFDSFFQFLSEYLLDDTDLMSIKPNPSDETFHVVKKQSHFAGYIGCQLFFKAERIEDLIWSAIGLHVIFDIQLPERMRNLTLFLLKYFKNEDLLKPKSKGKIEALPSLVMKKLHKDNIL